MSQPRVRIHPVLAAVVGLLTAVAPAGPAAAASLDGPPAHLDRSVEAPVVDPAGAEPAGGPVPASLKLATSQAMARDAGPAYRISAGGLGTNPGNGFDVAFTATGVAVGVPAGSFGLRLARAGRDGGTPVSTGEPRVDGARVEYHRDAGLTERFVNLPQGLGQLWTVAESPAGNGPLVLAQDTGRAPDRSGDRSLSWSGLSYQGLAAVDAAGRELTVELGHEGARMTLEVDDTFASYPVVVEAWVQESKLAASDGSPGDRFGTSVALSGDTAVVGSVLAQVGGNDAQGAAYVFSRDGDAWTEQAKLTASDGAALDRFGGAMAMDGDVLLVGAWGRDGQRGAAYVFTGSGGSWSEQAKLVAADRAGGDLFGEFVAVDGGTAVVGAWGADLGGNAEQGAAYVFTRDGAAWTQQAKLTAPDGDGNDQFGKAVAVDGDTVLVGSPFAAVGGNFLQGAVYAFERAGGTWQAPVTLTASDGAPLDRLGFSVALDGDTAVAGAIGAAVGGTARVGAAYVFVRTGDGWSEQAKLGASDGVAFDNFGVFAAITGDRAVVGADFATVGGDSLRGAAYVFGRDGESWSEQAKLTASGGGAGETFGEAVALAGDTALVGALFTDGARGAAYLFTRSGEGWTEEAELAAGDGVAGDQFGNSVAAGAAVVGAWTADVGGNGTQGTAYAFDLEAPEPGAPQVAVDPASLAVELEAGATATEPLTIGNLGEADLTWAIAVAGSDCGTPGGVPWLSVDPAAGTVAGGGNQQAGVTFDDAAALPGDHEAVL